MLEYIKKIGTFLKSNFILYTPSFFNSYFTEREVYGKTLYDSIDNTKNKLQKLGYNEYLSIPIENKYIHLIKKLANYLDQAVKNNESLEKLKSIFPTDYLFHLAYQSILEGNDERLRILIKIGLGPNPQDLHSILLKNAASCFISPHYPKVNAKCIEALLEVGAKFPPLETKPFPIEFPPMNQMKYGIAKLHIENIDKFVDLIHLKWQPVVWFKILTTNQLNPKQVKDEYARCKLLYSSKILLLELNLVPEFKVFSQDTLNKIDRYMLTVMPTYVGKCLEYLIDPLMSDQAKYKKCDLLLLESISQHPKVDDETKQNITKIIQQIEVIKRKSFGGTIWNKTKKHTDREKERQARQEAQENGLSH